ncbi:MAG TPA: histidine phosphatase family protein [Ruania sp.]|nr:histidine phosphatase family protein [Ruania sp.]
MSDIEVPTKRLTVLRHAQAEQNAIHDVDRGLTLAGRGDARVIGERLHEAGVRPQLVLCSSAARAQQTWQLVANAYGEDAEAIEVQYLELLYGADLEEVLTLLHEVSEETADVLLVGHEPVSSAVAHHLAGPSSQEAAALRVRTGLSTATAALLSYRGPWSRLDRHGAVLTALATCRS